MKKRLFISMLIVMALSCSKEQISTTRELNIFLKSSASVGNTNGSAGVTIYPNPFQDFVAIGINGSNNAQVLISNANGDKKKISMTTSMATFDFSKEKAGAYYCEVLTNGTVYRTYLIKY